MPDGFGDNFSSEAIALWGSGRNPDWILHDVVSGIIAGQVRHLRYEHNMKMRDIASRLGIRYSLVREILNVDSE